MVFVSPLGAGSYGTLPEGTARGSSTSRRTALLLVTTVLVAGACLSLVAAFELIRNHSKQPALVQLTSDSFLFKTPTLKSLVSTFMKEQGASKGDIAEVDKYYSSKKSAKIQMLSELDPAMESNRGQTLSWKPANEVVGAAFQPIMDAISRQQPESVIEQPSEPLMEAEVDPSSLRADELLPKSEVGLSDNMPSQQAFGTDQVYMAPGIPGNGQSTKAAMQQLWNAAESDQLDLKTGRRAFVRDERKFRQTNSKWLKKMPSYWNKAPVEELYDMPSQFHDHAPRGIVPLLNPGAMGTNHAFLNRRTDGAGRSWYQGMGDGSGVTTKGRLELLAEQGAKDRHVVPLPDAGEVGTDAAFLAQKTNEAGGRWLEGLGDGSGQSTLDQRSEALATLSTDSV